MIRIGHGFDVHAFGENRPLIIGGVEVPYHTGFIAHSDGDVALHALTDAILGAAALGDIGKLFPDTDIQYKNADSRGLLRDAFRQVQEKGSKIGNVHVTIISQTPQSSHQIEPLRTQKDYNLPLDLL
ncbi:2-C-methyl-D-erythritol 2,4-cyclodiphosphate synthase [Helicobacter pylori]